MEHYNSEEQLIAKNFNDFVRPPSRRPPPIGVVRPALPRRTFKRRRCIRRIPVIISGKVFDVVTGDSMEVEDDIWQPKYPGSAREKPNITIPFAIPDEAHKAVREGFPEYAIHRGEASETRTHPITACIRYLFCRHLVDSSLGTVLDVGGLVKPHALRYSRCKRVHVIRPVLGAADVERAYRDKKSIEKLCRDDIRNVTVCDSSLAACEVKGDEMMMVDVYDIPVLAVAEAMIHHDTTILNGCMIWVPDALVDPEKPLPTLGIVYKVIWTKNNTIVDKADLRKPENWPSMSICFDHSDGSRGYVHNFYTYMSWVVCPPHFKVKDQVFNFEVTRVVAHHYVGYKIFRAGDVSTTSTVRALFLDRDELILTAACEDGPFRRKAVREYLIPKKLYDNIFVQVTRTISNNSKKDASYAEIFPEVMAVVQSMDTRITVNGSDILAHRLLERPGVRTAAALTITYAYNQNIMTARSALAAASTRTPVLTWSNKWQWAAGRLGTTINYVIPQESPLWPLLASASAIATARLTISAAHELAALISTCTDEWARVEGAFWDYIDGDNDCEETYEAPVEAPPIIINTLRDDDTVNVGPAWEFCSGKSRRRLYNCASRFVPTQTTCQSLREYPDRVRKNALTFFATLKQFVDDMTARLRCLRSAHSPTLHALVAKVLSLIRWLIECIQAWGRSHHVERVKDTATALTNDAMAIFKHKIVTTHAARAHAEARRALAAGRQIVDAVSASPHAERAQAEARRALAVGRDVFGAVSTSPHAERVHAEARRALAAGRDIIGAIAASLPNVKSCSARGYTHRPRLLSIGHHHHRIEDSLWRYQFTKTLKQDRAVPLEEIPDMELAPAGAWFSLSKLIPPLPLTIAVGSAAAYYRGINRWQAVATALLALASDGAPAWATTAMAVGISGNQLASTLAGVATFYMQQAGAVWVPEHHLVRLITAFTTGLTVATGVYRLGCLILTSAATAQAAVSALPLFSPNVTLRRRGFYQYGETIGSTDDLVDRRAAPAIALGVVVGMFLPPKMVVAISGSLYHYRRYLGNLPGPYLKSMASLHPAEITMAPVSSLMLKSHEFKSVHTEENTVQYEEYAREATEAFKREITETVSALDAIEEEEERPPQPTYVTGEDRVSACDLRDVPAFTEVPAGSEEFEHLALGTTRVEANNKLRLYNPEFHTELPDPIRRSIVEAASSEMISAQGSIAALECLGSSTPSDFYASSIIEGKEKDVPAGQPYYINGQLYLATKTTKSDTVVRYAPDADYMFALHHVIALNSARVRKSIHEYEGCLVHHVDGVPGCGKTHAIVAKVGDNDVVVTQNRAGAADIQERLKRLGKKTKCMTISSLLINDRHKFGKPGTLYVDECVLTHAGLIHIAAALTNAVQITAYGDSKQIHASSFSPEVEFRYHVLEATTTAFMQLTHRLPQDTVRALRCDYPTMVTNSQVNKSIEFVSTIPGCDDLMAITMTQNEKKTFLQKHPDFQDGKTHPTGRRVLTVHEAQGQSVANVLFFRLECKQVVLYDVVKGTWTPHQRVAISRHTRKLYLYTAPGAPQQLFDAVIDAASGDADVLVSDRSVKFNTNPANSATTAVHGSDEDGESLLQAITQHGTEYLLDYQHYDNTCWAKTIVPLLASCIGDVPGPSVRAGLVIYHTHLSTNEAQDAVQVATTVLSTWGYSVYQGPDGPNADITFIVDADRTLEATDAEYTWYYTTHPAHWQPDEPATYDLRVFVKKGSGDAEAVSRTLRSSLAGDIDAQKTIDRYAKNTTPAGKPNSCRGERKAIELFQDVDDSVADWAAAPGGATKALRAQGLLEKSLYCSPLNGEGLLAPSSHLTSAKTSVAVPILPEAEDSEFKAVFDQWVNASGDANIIFCDGALPQTNTQQDQGHYNRRFLIAGIEAAKLGYVVCVKSFASHYVYNKLAAETSLCVEAQKPPSSPHTNLEVYLWLSLYNDALSPQDIEERDYCLRSEFQMIYCSFILAYYAAFHNNSNSSKKGAGALPRALSRYTPAEAAVSQVIYMDEPTVYLPKCKQELKHLVLFQRDYDNSPPEAVRWVHHPLIEERIDIEAVVYSAYYYTAHYAMIFPMFENVDQQYDALCVDSGEISVYPPSKFTLNTGRYSRYVRRPAALVPMIETSASFKRRNTTRETLVAVNKRNFDIVVLTTPCDVQIVAARAIDACIKYFCRPSAEVLLRYFRQNPVTYSLASVERWLHQLDSNKVNRHKASKFDMHQFSLAQFDVSLKTTCKSRAEPLPQETYQKLQTICSHPVALTSFWSPIMGQLVRRFQRLLRSNVCCAIGLSPREIEALINANDNDRSRTHRAEMDFKSFDKTQLGVSHAVKMMWFEWLGMAPDLLRLWDYSHRITTNKAPGAGVEFTTFFQQKSGDAATAFGNTLVSMTTTAYSLRPTEFNYALFIGDDTMIEGTTAPVSVEQAERFGRVFNITSKIMKHDHSYFCGHFIVRGRDHTLMIADPVKRLEKLGRKDVRDFEHLEEIRVATLDLLRHYCDAEACALITRAVLNRYGNAPDMTFVMPAIRGLYANTSSLRSVFHS